MAKKNNYLYFFILSFVFQLSFHFRSRFFLLFLPPGSGSTSSMRILIRFALNYYGFFHIWLLNTSRFYSDIVMKK